MIKEALLNPICDAPRIYFYEMNSYPLRFAFFFRSIFDKVFALFHLHPAYYSMFCD